MRHLVPITLLLAGCGDFGLLMTMDTGTGDGPFMFDPEGQAEFGRASPNGRNVEMDVTIACVSDQEAYVADAWVESNTQGVFTTNDDLPFPMRLDPGRGVTVKLKFLPNAQGNFRGTFVVEDNLGNLTTLPLVGTGCSDGDRDGDC
jgi:alkyl hydroperoxide reductase subunit AhpC